uniref:Family with sequence similarity 184 member A n=1 Tax=Oryzias melastigma TaxID=30732 RepID=A0A3B3BJV6_ORYME
VSADLNVAHQRETQILLADFNKAQEVLKDKISALQILLEGTEEKLRNRESRPEDLHLIAELREMVSEREALVKKLVDDKKFYQLELVNRETSFNKVFNSSANVGVINPLIKVSPQCPAHRAALFSVFLLSMFLRVPLKVHGPEALNCRSESRQIRFFLLRRSSLQRTFDPQRSNPLLEKT